jgi:hypothetical protein
VNLGLGLLLAGERHCFKRARQRFERGEHAVEPSSRLASSIVFSGTFQRLAPGSAAHRESESAFSASSSARSICAVASAMVLTARSRVRRAASVTFGASSGAMP